MSAELDESSGRTALQRRQTLRLIRERDRWKALVKRLLRAIEDHKMEGAGVCAAVNDAKRAMKEAKK